MFLESMIFFNNPIYVRSDVLGESCDICVGKEKMTMFFPTKPSIDIIPKGRFLGQPISINEKLHLDPEYWNDKWGSGIMKNKENEIIVASISGADIICQSIDFEASKKNFLSKIDTWRDLLEKAITLKEKGTNGPSVYKYGSRKEGISLFKVDEEKTQRIDSTPEFSLATQIKSEEKFMGRENLFSILSEIDVDKKIKIEYQMLIDAYSERNNRNYRIALIQALTAVELSINRRIGSLDKHLKKYIGSISFGSKFQLLEAYDFDCGIKDTGKAFVNYKR